MPTVLMQPNIRETLIRRGLTATRQENLRYAYNAQRAVDDFVDALESGDDAAVDKLAEELTNVYKIRLGSTDRIQRAIEARSISQTLRNLEGHPQLLDQYIKIYREHGIGTD